MPIGVFSTTKTSNTTQESFLLESSPIPTIDNSHQGGYGTVVLNTANEDDEDRRHSTGTLRRLILVANALEQYAEMNLKQMNGSRIVFMLRNANMILLIVINVLVLVGVGKYESSSEDGHGKMQSLMLSFDKWPHYNDEMHLPDTFSEMRLDGQYIAISVLLILLAIIALLQLLHIFNCNYPKLLCLGYAFGAVPLSLFVFGIEMHYSSCPWLDDYYKRRALNDNDDSAFDDRYRASCAINAWAIAGVFSLLSCGLFISDGLMNIFHRADDRNRINVETVV